MRRKLTCKHLSMTFIALILSSVLVLHFSATYLGGMMDSRFDRIDRIFEKTKTVCFGRFLMEVPVNSVMIYGNTTIDGNIEFHEGRAQEIPEILASRMSEIEEERSNLPDYSVANLPLAGDVVEGAISGQKTVFGIKDSISYRIHSYIPIGKDLFVYDSSAFPEHNEIPFIDNLAKNLRRRLDLEIPSEPGICIKSGFVAVDPTFESVSIGLRFLDFPDVHLSIDARKNQDYLAEGSGLEESRASAESRAEAMGFGGFFARIKVIRESQRQLGVWKGEEILTRRPEYKDDTDAHEFRFFSLGGVNDAAHPMLDIQLDSGVKGNMKARAKPSITDEEATVLWDRVLPSIRLRQSSDATSPKQNLSKVPIGSLSKSGDICPQSGWWKCVDEGTVRSDSRRIFREGERMPLALVMHKGGIWQRLIGSASHAVNVKWILLEYENEKALPSVAQEHNFESVGSNKGDRSA